MISDVIESQGTGADKAVPLPDGPPDTPKEPGQAELFKAIDQARLLQAFRRRLTAADAFTYEHRRQAFLNEQYINGNQFIGPNVVSNSTYVRPQWYNNFPKKAKPILHNIALTWASILTKDRPSVYGVGQGNSIQDKSAAEIATLLIEYLEQELKIDDFIYEMVYQGGITGTAGIKVCYVEREQPQPAPGPEIESFETEAQEISTGDLYLERLSIEDFFCDPQAQDFNESRWVIFKKRLTYDQAEDLCEAAGIDVPKETVEYDGHNKQRTCIMSYEFWMRPCKQYPRGFYAHIIGDSIVELVEEYPYQFVRHSDGLMEYPLPAVFFQARRVRGSPYGETFVSDALNLQQGINEVLSRLFKLWQDTSSVQKVLPSSVKDGFINENSFLFLNADQMQYASIIGKYTDPPQVSQLYQYLLQYFEQAIYDVSGVSEATTGQADAASQSGVAKQYQAQLDALKTADAVKSLDKAVQDLYSLILKVVQRFWSAPRLLNIFDDATQQASTLAFKAADIQGIDVRLQMRSGRDALQASKQDDAMQRLQTGLISQSKADSLVGSVGSLLAQEQAHQLIDQFLQTGSVQIEPQDLDPELMVGAIEQRQQAALLEAKPQDFERLEQLKRAYVADVQQAQQQPAGPPAASSSVAPNEPSDQTAKAELPSAITPQPKARPGNKTRHGLPPG